MIIDRKINRNSGATLEPCVYKHGHGVREQGLKMLLYPKVFAPILDLADDGYYMPLLVPPSAQCLTPALERLAELWVSTPIADLKSTNRQHHHAVQIAPFVAADAVSCALDYWYQKTASIVGRAVTVVHGDPTLENYMHGGIWLDPSIRAMPLEAEFDGGKLLQSYFGYGNAPYHDDRAHVKRFLHEQGLNIDLCMYYLVTHVVRLYRVQPQARAWALELVLFRDGNMKALKELRCR